jgi:hypothetical protein
MRSLMDGGLKKAAVMHGERCIAPITTKNADAANLHYERMEYSKEFWDPCEAD